MGQPSIVRAERIRRTADAAGDFSVSAGHGADLAPTSHPMGGGTGLPAADRRRDRRAPAVRPTTGRSTAARRRDPRPRWRRIQPVPVRRRSRYASWAAKVILSNPEADNEWLTKACNTPHSGIEVDCLVPNNSRRRAGTAPASRAIPLAECDCRHIHAARFPRPVHPAALLRRRTHHGSEPDPFIVTGLAG